MPPTRRRWSLFAGAAVVAAVVVLFGTAGVTQRPELPPRSVEDAEFARRANASCSRALPALRRQQREGGRASDDPALAPRVDRAADGLQRLVGELRAIPVAPADQPEVDRWLDDWDGFVSVGRRFADALRRRDARARATTETEGNRFSRRIFGFAKANGMPACVP